MRLAILVTHLLGTGHLKRAALLADGFMAAGHEVIVLSGGFPAPNAAPDLAKLIQLPPLRSDVSFSTLSGEDGEATHELFAAREAAIRDTLTEFSPDMLITELFPFGRRKLASEFETAIEAAGNALICCSIRDILQYPRKNGRAAEAEARFSNLYDVAFIHGDPALVSLDKSWALPSPLKSKIAYTGYIAENTEPVAQASTNEIIVAAGGGSVGQRLFEAAADAGDENWRLLVGGHDRDARIAQLQARGGRTIIEGTRADFGSLLGRADVAVLQCGYNTAMDIVQSGVRAVFVPFEGDGETEQITRARAFGHRFGSGLIREQDLSADLLRDAVDRLGQSPKPDYSMIGRDGVNRTIALAEKALETRK